MASYTGDDEDNYFSGNLYEYYYINGGNGSDNLTGGLIYNIIYGGEGGRLYLWSRL